jgi:hypothetical protein
MGDKTTARRSNLLSSDYDIERKSYNLLQDRIPFKRLLRAREERFFFDNREQKASMKLFLCWLFSFLIKIFIV